MTTELRGIGGGRDPWSDRLSDYLDGGLSPADRQGLEAHLTSCPACAVALADLREVVARARTLEDAPPAQDLWAGIEAQLTARSATTRPLGTVLRGAFWARRFDLGVPQLAAAAVLLIALSSGAVWLALRGPALPDTGRPAPRGTLAAGSTASPVRPDRSADAPGAVPIVRPEPAVEASVASTASTNGANPRYDAAVAELERTLEDGRGRLDPRTLQVVEENLHIIDRAIEDARRAVAADPGNTWLRSHLAATMKRKVDLLRSATMLATAQG